jgi:RNA polymerase sigma-70 factor (ECF subfamily)
MEFPSTRWTQLAKVTLHGDSAAGMALAEFCRAYRRPVMQFLRWRGVPEHRVEDLTHDFLLHLLKHSALKRADRSRGRFRNYLCAALVRFMANDAGANAALKRGGGAEHISLEAAGDGCGTPPQPSAGESLFLDREWALNVMQCAVEDIGREASESGKGERFAALRPFLPGATMPADYAEAARLTGMTETHVRTEVSRLRKRFREIVRSRVAATLSSPLDVDDELAHLHRVLTAAVIPSPD